jgi:pyruvate,water dikinase
VRHANRGSARRRKEGGHLRSGPSDYPDFAVFLVEKGIDSISLTPDSVVPTTIKILEVERGS